jgi:hypothetical protein
MKNMTSQEGIISKTPIESLFIPVIYTTIGEEKVREVFEKGNIAIIASVNFVPKVINNGSGNKKINVNMAFIHVAYWIPSESSKRFQNEIRSNEKGTKLTYNDPYYWIVLENKSVNQPTKMAMEGILPLPEKESSIIYEATKETTKEMNVSNVEEIATYDEDIPEALETAIKYCEDAKKILENKIEEINKKMKNLIKTKKEIINEKQEEIRTPDTSVEEKEKEKKVPNAPVRSRKMTFNELVNSKKIVPKFKKPIVRRLFRTNDDEDYYENNRENNRENNIEKEENTTNQVSHINNLKELSKKDEELLMRFGIIIN